MNAHILKAGSLAVLLGSSAGADETPAIAITDRADHVEIVASGASAGARVRPEARGPWLDVALEKVQRAATVLSPESDLVTKRGDIVLGDKPRLSVLFHHDAKPEDFARNTQIEQTPGALVVRIPHAAGHVLPAPSSDGSASAKGAPAAAGAGRAAEAAQILAPSPSGRGRAPAVAHAAAVASERTAASAAPVAAAAAEGAALAAIADDKPLLAVVPTSEGHHTTLYVAMLFLSAFGVISILLARRRRLATPPAQLLRVMNTCQLAPRVKAMLVAVGDREMLLSVGDGGAQVLARWRAEGGSAEPAFELEEPLDLDAPLSTPIESAPPPPTVVARSAREPARESAASRALDLPEIDLELPPLQPTRSAPSPAVAGLLKLRRDGGRSVGNPVADEQWARDLLAAMRNSATGRSRGIVR